MIEGGRRVLASPYPDGRELPRLFLVFVAMFLVMSFVVSPNHPTLADRMVSVFVRELPTAQSQPENAVEELGGKVERHIRFIQGFRGFEATIPRQHVHELKDVPGVYSVTVNGQVAMW